MTYVLLEDLTEHIPPKEAFHKLAEIDSRFKVNEKVYVTEELAPSMETPFNTGDLSVKGMQVDKKFCRMAKKWYESFGKSIKGKGIPGVIIASFLGQSLLTLEELTQTISGHNLNNNHLYFSNDGNPTELYETQKIITETNKNLSIFLKPNTEHDLILKAQQGDEVSRNEILENNINWLNYLANKFPEELQEDLISEGIFGLINAINNYDHGRGVFFKTYATFRVMGRMRDSLRHQDFVPRLTRSRNKKIDYVTDEFFKEHGRTPSEYEIREKINPINFKEGRIQQVTSLSQVINKGENKNLETIDLLKNENEQDPFDEAASKDEFENLLNKFSTREQLIMKLLYCEELTMEKIGKIIGISESRVSQIHTQLLEQLKAKLTI